MGMTTKTCFKCKGTGAHWAGICYPCGGTGQIVYLSAAEKAAKADAARVEHEAWLASPGVQAREQRTAERAARQARRRLTEGVTA